MCRPMMWHGVGGRRELQDVAKVRMRGPVAISLGRLRVRIMRWLLSGLMRLHDGNPAVGSHGGSTSCWPVKRQ